MNLIYIIVGFITAVYGLGSILLAIVLQIPLAKKISKIHQVAMPQRIDGKLDLWYGPVPYGRIFIAPIIFFTTFLIISFFVYLIIPDFREDFGIGILIALIYNIIGFYDPKNNLKKDFNLLYGDNWLSNTLTNGTLQDEQKLKNLPTEVIEARNFLLSNQGNHSKTNEVLMAISVLNKYDKPNINKVKLKNSGFNNMEYKKILLCYTISEDEKEISYHFNSDVNL